MNSNQLGLFIVRFAATGCLLIHSITRLIQGSVPDFDEYLTSLGFPPFTAWAITFFELFGGIAVIVGKKWVSPICILFCLHLTMGIALVHFSEGWFVVGGGRNGMEYSVLLIFCFAGTAVANWKNPKFSFSSLK